MSKFSITEKQARLSYGVLVSLAGADPDERQEDSFVRYVTSEDGCPKEWRFQGKLGFGGKFRVNYGVYVDCYPEHMTPERSKIVEATNAALTKALAKSN